MNLRFYIITLRTDSFDATGNTYLKTVIKEPTIIAMPADPAENDNEDEIRKALIEKVSKGLFPDYLVQSASEIKSHEYNERDLIKAVRNNVGFDGLEYRRKVGLPIVAVPHINKSELISTELPIFVVRELRGMQLLEVLKAIHVIRMYK